MYQFQAFDPFNSFALEGRKFVDRSGKESDWSRVRDSDDALELWRLGRDAFQALGGFESQTDFDEAFAEHKAGIKMLTEIVQADEGRIDFRNADGVSWKPDFSKLESMAILEIFWQLPNAEEKVGDLLANHFLFACLEEIDSALIGLALDSDLVGAVINAVTALGNFQAISTGNKALQKARSDLAFHAAKERHARDPKQAEKKFVFECWIEWCKKPETYKGKAAFARDMLDKCTVLESQKVIEDWCREWEKTRKL